MAGLGEASERGHPLAGLRAACLVGPTAAGKSRLALALAERTGAEIISLDSMLVYRGMDIGTAKPRAHERARVRHHMLDLVDPCERYDVSCYLSDLAAVTRDLRARGKPALFVGGTAFYLKALLHGLFDGPRVDLELRRELEARAEREGNGELHRELARIDPRAASRIHEHDTKRLVRAFEVYTQTGRTLSDWQTQWNRPRDEAPGAHVRLVGLELAVPELDRRIRTRTEAMLAGGWREEALAIESGTGFSPTSAQALGYQDVLAWARGELSHADCVERVFRSTRQFARRQRTWYRKFDAIQWLRAGDEADPQAARECLAAAERHLGWS